MLLYTLTHSSPPSPIDDDTLTAVESQSISLKRAFSPLQYFPIEETRRDDKSYRTAPAPPPSTTTKLASMKRSSSGSSMFICVCELSGAGKVSSQSSEWGSNARAFVAIQFPINLNKLLPCRSSSTDNNKSNEGIPFRPRFFAMDGEGHGGGWWLPRRARDKTDIETRLVFRFPECFTYLLPRRHHVSRSFSVWV